jgi:hypothetical protein
MSDISFVAPVRALRGVSAMVLEQVISETFEVGFHLSHIGLYAVRPLGLILSVLYHGNAP